MVRDHNYQKIHDYFESLVTRNVDLQEFIGASIEELVEKLSSHDGVSSPFLFFYEYKNKLMGNDQRTFNQKTLSFGIGYLGIKNNDFAAQKEAITNAETIGLEIISRIYYDSKTQDVKWLYNNFIKESCSFEPFEDETIAGFYGMDFHFDVKVTEPLIVTPEKWSDGGVICVS